MNEDLLQTVGAGHATLKHNSDVAASEAPARQVSTTQLRPSAMARQFSSGAVKLLDKGAVLIALALTLFDAPLNQGQSLVSYLAARVSLRNVLIATALLTFWRLLCWVVGLYQSNLNHRAVVLLWKVPVIAFLCAGPV